MLPDAQTIARADFEQYRRTGRTITGRTYIRRGDDLVPADDRIQRTDPLTDEEQATVDAVRRGECEPLIGLQLAAEGEVVPFATVCVPAIQPPLTPAEREWARAAMARALAHPHAPTEL